MVKSEKVYTPRDYLRRVLGKYVPFPVACKDDADELDRILKEHGYWFWNYPLSEIDHIVENKLNVVLVRCNVWVKRVKKNGYVDYDVHTEYRWFEVPEDFVDEEVQR